MFFVGMAEKMHPGFRDWFNATCQQAGFTPRVLQDAELGPALMSFVAGPQNIVPVPTRPALVSEASNGVTADARSFVFNVQF